MVELPPEEKLAILQGADLRRRWYSLDDQRVCVLCDRTISGRQVDVSQAASGGYAVHCPTPGCASLPSDWFYQGNASSSSVGATLGRRDASIWGS